MKVKELLTEEIERQLGSLDEIPLCSEENTTAIDSVTKLLDRLNEMEKTELESLDKIKSREIEKLEHELKMKQAEEERRDHVVKNTLTAVSVIGGFAVTIWGTLKSIEFEKEGTITTIMGRGFINKLLPKK